MNLSFQYKILFIIFGILIQFNAIVSYNRSYVPIAFLVPTSLFFFRFCALLCEGKNPLGFSVKRPSFYFVLFFLTSVILGLPRLFVFGEVEEFSIRIFQFVGALSFFTYAINNFFLPWTPQKALRILLLLQLPSLLFGYLEILIYITHASIFNNIALAIRAVTNTFDVGVMGRGLVFFYAESSQSIYYIIFFGFLLLSLYQLEGRNIFKWHYGKFAFISFALFLLFHKSGSYLLFLFASIIYIATFFKMNVWRKLFFIFSSCAMFVIALTDFIAMRLQLLVSQDPDQSFVTRIASLGRGFNDLIYTGFLGYGFGQYGNSAREGLVNLAETLTQISPFIGDIIFSSPETGAIVSELDFGRKPFYSVYSGLMSEMGLLFIFFLFFFHISPMLSARTQVFRYFYFISLIMLFWGIPFAFPFVWIILGHTYVQQKWYLTDILKERTC